MPQLSEHQSQKYFKILLIGDSGTGKTGALVSLIEAGYKLRIIDFDNGLDALVALARERNLDLSSVEYHTLRDKYKFTASGPRLVKATAFTKAGNLLDKWSDGTKPEEWGSEYVLVFDSLTHMGNSALAWAKQANPAVHHKQMLSGAGQEVMEYMIATITADEFQTNVLCISHVDYRRLNPKDEESPVRGYVASLGQALGKKIPTYFNTLLLAVSKTVGSKSKRTIRTVPTTDIDLKNPGASKMAPEYPLETGLVSITKILKGEK